MLEKRLLTVMGWGYHQMDIFRVSPGIFFFFFFSVCLAFLWLAFLLLPCEALAGSHNG